MQTLSSKEKQERHDVQYNYISKMAGKEKEVLINLKRFQFLIVDLCPAHMIYFMWKKRKEIQDDIFFKMCFFIIRRF